MCISKAYLNDVTQSNLIMDMVAKVGYRGNKIVLTDILGREREEEGELSAVDLLENFIVIKTANA